jgi:prolyl oligopeptidase PreP (S9A serine peptidase family)
VRLVRRSWQRHASEVPSIVDDLLDRGWAREDRIGIGGRSLGGNVAYASVWLTGSVTMLP